MTDETILDRVMDLFEAHPRKMLPYRYIYESCWKVPWYSSCSSNLRSMIRYARRSLSGKITSVRGRGYIYSGEEQ